MDLNIVFDGIQNSNVSLWDRIKVFSEELNLQPEDEGIFVTENAGTMSFYINNYLHQIVSVGVHLARVRKVKGKLENKLQKIFDNKYIEITDKCVAGANSSKFDQNYRAGKARQAEKYSEYSTLIADIAELEGTLVAVKEALHVKSMVLPSMFKLDKNQFI